MEGAKTAIPAILHDNKHMGFPEGNVSVANDASVYTDSHSNEMKEIPVRRIRSLQSRGRKRSVLRTAKNQMHYGVLGDHFPYDWLA